MSTIDGKDDATRKAVPLATGCLDYFPDALIAVAELSRIGNDKHNPGQPLRWSRGKSNDHPDCLLRHLTDRGKVDNDGIRHSVKVAWRALAILQLEIEQAAKTAGEKIPVHSFGQIVGAVVVNGVLQVEHRGAVIDRRVRIQDSTFMRRTQSNGFGRRKTDEVPKGYLL